MRRNVPPRSACQEIPQGRAGDRLAVGVSCPSARLDPRSGREMRPHVLESGLQKAVKRAAAQAGLDKKVGCQTLRHSFATHMLEHGVNIRVLQELLGHADVKTTEMYTHVMARDIRPLQSPLDRLQG
jgi:integrase